jgi:hypothetical protein
MCTYQNLDHIVTPYEGKSKYYNLFKKEEFELNNDGYSKTHNLTYDFKIGVVNTKEDKYIIVQMFCNKILYYKKEWTFSKNSRVLVNLALKYLYEEYIADIRRFAVNSMYTSSKEF